MTAKEAIQILTEYLKKNCHCFKCGSSGIARAMAMQWGADNEDKE